MGGFDAGYAQRGIGGLEDYEFQLKLLRRYRIELVREFLVGYRVRKGQMSDDTVRMSRARLATIEAALADCELPEAKRNRALAHARVVAAYREALARDRLRAATTLVRSLVRSPRLTWRWIAELAALRNVRRRSGPPDDEPGPPPPRFHELAPDDGIVTEGEVSDQTRARLAGFRERPADQLPGGEAPEDRSA